MSFFFLFFDQNHRNLGAIRTVLLANVWIGGFPSDEFCQPATQKNLEEGEERVVFGGDDGVDFEEGVKVEKSGEAQGRRD